MDFISNCKTETCCDCRNFKEEPPDYPTNDYGFCKVRGFKKVRCDDTCQAFHPNFFQTDEFEQKEHHGKTVWCRKGQDNLHRDICLCSSCNKFKPESPEMSCDQARILFAICTTYGMTTPVLECPKMEPLK